MESEKKRRKQYSLREKWKMIIEAENGKSKAEIEKEYGIRPTTLWNVLNRKEKIYKQIQKNTAEPQRRRLRKGAHENLELYVYKWFVKMRSRNVAVKGPMLCKKARFYCNLLGIQNFSASCGWLCRFRRRYGITSAAMSEKSEENSKNANQTLTWTDSEVREVLSNYSHDDIYCLKETALFYQLLPGNSKELKGETCSCGKLSKYRITVLLSCNASGTDKVTPHVIGKYKNPSNGSLPCSYKPNIRAWITPDIFNEWIIGFDARMNVEQRNIVLLLNHSVPHRLISSLQNIKVLFFPEANLETLDPFNQGIISSMKWNFRYKSMEIMKAQTKLGKQPEISLVDAITVVTLSWMNVAERLIQSCWMKTGILPRFDNEKELILGNDKLFRQLPGIQRLWIEVVDLLDVPANVSLSDFLTADDKLAVASEFSYNCFKQQIDAHEYNNDELSSFSDEDI